MENSGNAVHKKEERNQVKEQRILCHVNKIEELAAKNWEKKWGFMKDFKKIQREEALKIGISPEEYDRSLRLLSCEVQPERSPVSAEPSPKPLPETTSQEIGYRAKCNLERFGKLVKTAKDVPLHPPLPPGQDYDPYVQTFIYLGTLISDPISYKLPPQRPEAEEKWSLPQQLTVSPFQFQYL